MANCLEFPILNALLHNQAIQLQYQNLVCNAMVLKHFSQLQPPKSPKIEVFALTGHDLLTHNKYVRLWNSGQLYAKGS
jgi:hypothetical protein